MAVDGTGAARHRRRWLAVLVVLAMGVAACSTSDEPENIAEETSTTIPQAQTLLRVGVEAWPDCLNPLTCDSPALREQVLAHVLPVAFEVDADNDLRPSALLVGRPEVATSGSGMSVTYRIDPAARWNDGQPITSSDFRGTWQAVLNTPAADRSGFDQIVAVDDTDPLVAVVRFSTPYSDWKLLFGAGHGWVLRADSFGTSTDLTGMFLDELAFSAGPYRLATWDDDAAVLAAAEDHWAPDQVPEIDQVRLVRLDEIDDLVQPDAFDMLIPAGLDVGPTPDGFEPRAVPTTRVLGIWFDRRTPLLDPLVNRQVLSALIDRSRTIAAATNADRDPIGCLGWLPDVGPWCEAASVDLRPTNADLASFVLFSDGWRPDPAFGTQVRDGQPFVVPLSVDPTVPGASEVADLLAEAFGEVGIGVTRSEIASDDWRATRDAASPTGVGVYPVDLGISPRVDEIYGCADGPGSNVLFWCPAELMELGAALAVAVDRAEQEALVEDIGTFADAAVAWIPVVQLTATSFLGLGRVVVPDATPVVGGALGHLHRFEVEG